VFLNIFAVVNATV